METDYRELTLDEIEAMYARYVEIVETERAAGRTEGNSSDEAWAEARPLMKDCFHAVPALVAEVRRLQKLNNFFFRLMRAIVDDDQAFFATVQTALEHADAQDGNITTA